MTTGSVAEPHELPDPAMRLRGALLLTLAALGAFAPLSLDFYLPAFPAIASSLGVPIQDVQLTFSACLIGLGAGQLVYGPLSDRYGRKPPLLVGIGVFVIATTLCALAHSLSALIVTRLFMGLGGCAGIVISRAIVRDCFSGAGLARSFSVVISVGMLAPLLAPSIGAAVLGVASWEALFLLIAGMGAICLLAAMRLPETHPVHRRTNHDVEAALRGYASLITSRSFLAPAGIATLSSAMLFTYISSSSIAFMGGGGVNAQTFALIFGLMALCFVGGLRLNLRLLRTQNVRRLIQASLVAMVLALSALVVLNLVGAPLPASVLMLGVVKACLGGLIPNATGEAMDPYARSAGAASALLGSLQFGLGAGVAALLVALPFQPLLEMVGAMLAMALVALILASLPCGT